MRVVHANYFFDRNIRTPEELLEKYETLVGVAEGVRLAGADVSVAQRFHFDATIFSNGIEYRFVRDGFARFGGLLDPAGRMNRAIASLAPEVVHVHGLGFAVQAGRLSRLLGNVPLLIQDHADRPPVRRLTAAAMERAFRRIRMATFVSVAQARPWADTGILGSGTLVAELMEGSSRFHPVDQAFARKRTGLRGDPLCLWVGWLNSNKDPLTALEGFGRALRSLPEARLAVVTRGGPLARLVETWLADHVDIAGRVDFLGAIEHTDLANWYSSADVYLSASRREGSGYALLEALSCGASPAVTDIPSFRVLADYGRMGELWQPGDPEACADALVQAARRATAADRAERRAYFTSRFSFEAIGRRAVELYTHLDSHANARVTA